MCCAVVVVVVVVVVVITVDRNSGGADNSGSSGGGGGGGDGGGGAVTAWCCLWNSSRNSVPTFTQTTHSTQRLYLAPDSHPSNPREPSRGTRDHNQSNSRSWKPTAAVVGRAWWRLCVLLGGGGSGMLLVYTSPLTCSFLISFFRSASYFSF
jgi:hypothetical protein